MPHQPTRIHRSIHRALNCAIALLLFIAAEFSFRSTPDHYRPNALRRIPKLSKRQLTMLHDTFAIYVINLDKDTARLARFSARMQRNQLKFNRIAGIDGHQLNKQTCTKNHTISENFKKIATPGEIGCALAHRNAWKIAQSGTQPYAIFFEDDLMIDDALSYKLYQLAQYINKEDFDLLLLGRDLSTQPLCNTNKLPAHMCIYHDTNIYPKEEPSGVITKKIISPPYSGSAIAYIVPHARLQRLLHAISLNSKHCR